MPNKRAGDAAYPSGVPGLFPHAGSGVLGGQKPAPLLRLHGRQAVQESRRWSHPRDPAKAACTRGTNAYRRSAEDEPALVTLRTRDQPHRIISFLSGGAGVWWIWGVRRRAARPMTYADR